MQFQRKGAADWNARSPRVVARVRKTHLTLLESCLTCSNPIIKCNVRRNFLDLNGRKRIKVEKEKKVSSYVEPSIRPLAMVNFKSWLCSQRQRNLLEKVLRWSWCTRSRELLLCSCFVHKSFWFSTNHRPRVKYWLRKRMFRSISIIIPCLTCLIFKQ